MTLYSLGLFYMWNKNPLFKTFTDFWFTVHYRGKCPVINYSVVRMIKKIYYCSLCSLSNAICLTKFKLHHLFHFINVYNEYFCILLSLFALVKISFDLYLFIWLFLLVFLESKVFFLFEPVYFTSIIFIGGLYVIVGISDDKTIYLFLATDKKSQVSIRLVNVLKLICYI